MSKWLNCEGIAGEKKGYLLPFDSFPNEPQSSSEVFKFAWTVDSKIAEIPFNFWHGSVGHFLLFCYDMQIQQNVMLVGETGLPVGCKDEWIDPQNLFLFVKSENLGPGHHAQNSLSTAASESCRFIDQHKIWWACLWQGDEYKKSQGPTLELEPGSQPFCLEESILRISWTLSK